MIEPYSIALTSCGRFDLLRRTIATLLRHVDYPPEEIVVVEDSGDHQVEDIVRANNCFNAPVNLMVNENSIGQVRSIDMLYSKINTDWIFHCEDDWEFISNGFISKSISILREFDSCSMVSLIGKPPHPNEVSPIRFSSCGIAHFVAKARPNSSYAGLFFSPGMRRIRDYKIIGPYANIGVKVGEGIVSKIYQDLGYRIIFLENIYMQHIGCGRHIRDPIRELKGLKKMKRSASKRIEHLHWKFNPKTNPYTGIVNRFEQAKATMVNWHTWEDPKC